MFTEKEKEFLIGLTELTRKTGIAISGCGCCSSPYLIEAPGVDDPKSGYGKGAADVKWLYPDHIDFDKNSSTIIRN